MTTKTNTSKTAQVFVGALQPAPKYKVAQQARKRFSFGNVWLNAVLAGVIEDRQKLVAHAVKLKVGRKYDLNQLKFDTLLAKVQKAVAQ